MALLLDFLRAIFGALHAITMYFVERTEEAGIAPDFLLLVLLVFILTTWLWSGCWSGSIAEARRHSPKLHFFIGLCVPVLYPLVTLFTMDVKGARERSAQKAREEAEEAERRAEDERRRRAEEFRRDTGGSALEPGEPIEAVPETTFDQQYFKRIALDDEGNPTGPWLIAYGDTQIIAQRIVESLAHAVVIETLGHGAQLQRIRVPYAKISSCEPA